MNKTLSTVCLLLALLSVAKSGFIDYCTAYDAPCHQGYRFHMEFNYDKYGSPTYQDTMMYVFNGHSCNRIRYEMIFHKRLTCEKIDCATYECDQFTESVWVKIHSNAYKVAIQCNPDVERKFVDISVPCRAGTVEDPWKFLRNQVGKSEHVTIKLDMQDRPIVEGYELAKNQDCQWVYEVEGPWSPVVMYTIVISSVILVLTAVLAMVLVMRRRKPSSKAQISAILNKKLTSDVRGAVDV